MLDAKLHADASPSSSEIWINCPASVTLARGRQRLPTPYTREGTAAHHIAALRLMGRRKLPAAIEVDGELIEITQEMLDAVDVYVQYVRKRAREGELHVETRVEIPTDGEPIFGTSDAFIIYKDGWIEVVDYKHGRGVLVPPDGPQFRLYALGVLERVGMFTDVRSIVLTVVQPRAEGDTIKTAALSIDDLIAWEREVFQPAVARLAANDPTEIPGDHCRWCVRAGECQALAELMAENAMVAFDALPPDPVGMTDAELARVLQYGESIVRWLNAIRTEASARIDDGRQIDGFKLVAKRAQRKWSDQLAALHELEDRGIPLAEVMRIETIGTVERVLRQRKLKPEEVIYPYTVKESSGSTLVSDIDGRPAVPSGAELFDDLPAQISGPQ